jgi:putative tricarboxylic transport membrane protein
LASAIRFDTHWHLPVFFSIYQKQAAAMAVMGGISRMRRILLACVAAGAMVLSVQAFAADYKIMAPAAPGGGWDQTARTIQSSLQDEKISGSVQVVNVPGAGGTIGLAQFANSAKGDPSQLMVGGYVMVGAILTNASPVTLDQVTPIARLTGEFEAVVVPAASPIKTMAELVEKLKADPGAVSWAGGSAGGTDQITAGLIAKAVGVDPTKINYVAFSGGGEALAALLGGQVTVGISGYGEFESQIKSGALRIIGISSDAKVEGIDAPTFKEGGVDVAIQNWRMIAAPPGITPEQEAAISADVEKLAKSKTWQEQLKAKGWADTYLAGDEFKAQLKKDTDATAAILKDIGLVK